MKGSRDTLSSISILTADTWHLCGWGSGRISQSQPIRSLDDPTTLLPVVLVVVAVGVKIELLSLTLFTYKSSYLYPPPRTTFAHSSFDLGAARTHTHSRAPNQCFTFHSLHTSLFARHGSFLIPQFSSVCSSSFLHLITVFNLAFN